MTKLPLRLHRRLVKRDVVCLVYHTVADVALPHISPLYAYKTSRQFLDDIRALKSHYSIVAAADAGFVCDKPRLMITADDGLAECYIHMRPALLAEGVRATFFVVADLIDNRRLHYRHKAALCSSALRHTAETALLREWLLAAQERDEQAIDEVARDLGVSFPAFLEEHKPYLTSEQIVALKREGFVIGAHSVTHRRLDDLTLDVVESEIVDSCRRVAELTGADVVPFAFPYGAARLSPDWLRDVRRRHPIVGALFGTKGMKYDELLMHRIYADPPHAPAPMAVKAAYAATALKRASQAFGR